MPMPIMPNINQTFLPRQMAGGVGVGAAFAKSVNSPSAKFKKGLALQKTINDRNFKKPSATAAQSPASDFVGPNQDGSSGEPSFLPAPAMGSGPAANPNEALNQFAKEQLGGAEYRINRRHPERAPKIAAGSPYQGMTAGQAQLAVEDKFRGADKGAALDRSRALEFTPPSPAPLVQNATTPTAPKATAPKDSFLPRPMMENPNMAGGNLSAPQKATGQPLGTMTSTLATPQKATGEPMGTMQFAKLQPKRR